MLDTCDHAITLHVMASNSTPGSNNGALVQFFCEIAEIAECYSCDIGVFADELGMSMVFNVTGHITNDSLIDMHDEIISLMWRSTNLFDKYATVSEFD